MAVLPVGGREVAIGAGFRGARVWCAFPRAHGSRALAGLDLVELNYFTRAINPHRL